jgi:anthranilate phosphoribosyltransferase
MPTAIVLMNIKKGMISDTAEKLGRIDEVVEVYSVAGDYDLVAIVRVEEYERFNEVVANAIQNIPNIDETKTLMVFKTYKVEVI